MSNKPKKSEKIKVKPNKRLARLSMLINLIVLFLVLSLIGAFLVKGQFVKDGKNSEAIVIDIPQGSGLNAVSSILEDRDLIGNATFFKVSAYYKNQPAALKLMTEAGWN